MPSCASRSGFTRTRTANFCEPNTLTWATPLTVDSRCASWVSAYSATVDIGSVEELIEMKKIGKSAGFTLRSVGGAGSSGGSRRAAAAIAVCTSCAAASMSRLSANCMVIWVVPKAEFEVIVSSPGMVENCPSSGVATDEAMVSGEPPGRLAVTWMVGKSTFGNSLTGSLK